MKVSAAVLSVAAMFSCSGATNEADIKSLILSGTEVPVGSKTYVTGLRTMDYTDTFCGGSLITPNHILSAAHCSFFNFVNVGPHFTSPRPGDGQSIEVASRVRHPKFVKPDDNSDSYDFMILTLSRPAVNITPVALLRADPSTVVGQRATTIGWGQTGFASPMSEVLLRSDGPVVSDAACKAAGLSPLDESMMCAGGAKNTGACFGDSGGPLVLERPDGDVQIGVVSWGYPNSCGADGKPVVFSKISQVADWIASNAPGVKFV